jgi:hypothetical protein
MVARRVDQKRLVGPDLIAGHGLDPIVTPVQSLESSWSTWCGR